MLKTEFFFLLINLGGIASLLFLIYFILLTENSFNYSTA